MRKLNLIISTAFMTRQSAHSSAYIIRFKKRNNAWFKSRHSITYIYIHRCWLIRRVVSTRDDHSSHTYIYTRTPIYLFSLAFFDPIHVESTTRAFVPVYTSTRSCRGDRIVVFGPFLRLSRLCAAQLYTLSRASVLDLDNCVCVYARARATDVDDVLVFCGEFSFFSLFSHQQCHKGVCFS